MACTTYDTGLTMCRPTGSGMVRRHILHCPVCERRRRFVETFLGIWYGGLITCLGCGDSWMDGELTERPFKRAWRREEIRKAREKWATAVSPRHYRRAVRDLLEEQLSHG